MNLIKHYVLSGLRLNTCTKPHRIKHARQIPIARPETQIDTPIWRRLDLCPHQVLDGVP